MERWRLGGWLERVEQNVPQFQLTGKPSRVPRSVDSERLIPVHRDEAVAVASLLDVPSEENGK